MAKHNRPAPAEPVSSRTTMAILALGGLLVAALLVWALTRTVEPQATVADTAGFAPTPAISTAPTPTTTAPNPLTATPTQTATPFPTATPAAAADPSAAVPRMSVEDLREKMKTNAVTIVDVRDDASFAAGHIPGSVHIPFARVEGEMSTLPRGKPIVTYCT